MVFNALQKACSVVSVFPNVATVVSDQFDVSFSTVICNFKVLKNCFPFKNSADFSHSVASAFS